MTRWALLLCACSYGTHVPDITEPCPRVPIAAYTAGAEECILLDDVELALFKLDTSESCSGPPCLRLEPGQTAYVMEKIKPGPAARWTAQHGPCAEVPKCE